MTDTDVEEEWIRSLIDEAEHDLVFLPHEGSYRRVAATERYAMTNDSKHFSKERVPTCEIADAVAICAIRDLRVSLFRFGGFQQITVSVVPAAFNVRVSVGGETAAVVSFLLSRLEASAAAKVFQRDQSEHDPAIFDRIQEALARVVG